MSNYKICVYAIAKNEEKFARRWAESMYEADEITVLDTGSRDKTVEIFSEYPKIRVISEKTEPWRFDAARNRALEFVSEDADICISTDIDEYFNPGWRKGIEKALDSGATQIRYRYVWNFLPDGKEGTVFYADKIHARKDFKWIHPVHEVIKYTGSGENIVITAENVQLNHKADDTKSRKQYLPLLELSVKENPEDDRNLHYLGREYMFRGRYEDALETLRKHLSLPSSVWKDERCASLRYMGKCLLALGNKAEAEKTFFLACAEAPYLREPWIELAVYYYGTENWYGVIYTVQQALRIRERPCTYITSAEAWNELPYDLLSLAYYYTGNREKAIMNVEKAIAINPNDERLVNNRNLMAK